MESKTASLAEANQLNGGLFGSAAPHYANLVLLSISAWDWHRSVVLVLACRKRFRSHARCQSAVVLLNFVIILLVMVPSFQVHVSPKTPAKLGKTYYSLATAHAALGAVLVARTGIGCSNLRPLVCPGSASEMNPTRQGSNRRPRYPTLNVDSQS